MRAPWLSGPEESRDHPDLHVFARILSPMNDRRVRLHFHAITQRHLAAAALALRCYALEHDNRLPTELDDLVPDYLPALPTDPMAAAGRTLGYRPGPVDPVVYSVGDDGIDDLGDETSRYGKPLSVHASWRRWETEDAVVHLTPQPRLREPVDDDDDE
jgi:hypothetical protein